jgi:hypothetical protein
MKDEDKNDNEDLPILKELLVYSNEEDNKKTIGKNNDDNIENKKYIEKEENNSLENNENNNLEKQGGNNLENMEADHLDILGDNIDNNEKDFNIINNFNNLDFDQDYEILSFKSELEVLKQQIKEKDKLINEYNIQKSNIIGELINPDIKIAELNSLLKEEKDKTKNNLDIISKQDNKIESMKTMVKELDNQIEIQLKLAQETFDEYFSEQ